MSLDWPLYTFAFSVAALTIYCKPDLMQEVTLSPFLRPEVQNQHHWAEGGMSAGLRSPWRLCVRTRRLPSLAFPTASIPHLCGCVALVMLPPPLLCQMSLSISLVRTLVIPFQAYLDNLG